MDSWEHISRAVDYMEENLQNELNLSRCAAIAGYSKYHFLRLFKEAVGLTPGDYVRKRRLTEAVKRIAGDERYLADAAFAYGFNSKENFIRAFKAEHYILPSEYKGSLNSLKLYERFSFSPPDFAIQPVIKDIPAFSVTVYPSNEVSPPLFWNRYNARNLSRRLSGGKVCVDYGLCIWNAGEKKLDYFIGIPTAEAKGDTAGTVEMIIGGGLFAVFSSPPATQFDFVSTIHKTWDYINHAWLPQSGYAYTGGVEFECYIEQSRTFSEDIYVPVVPIQKEEDVK